MKKTIRKSPLNKSGEPGIPDDWYVEIVNMVKVQGFKVDATFVLLYLGSERDRKWNISCQDDGVKEKFESTERDLWQALRADTLPYSADLLEYTLDILQAGPNINVPKMLPTNPLLEEKPPEVILSDDPRTDKKPDN